MFYVWTWGVVLHCSAFQNKRYTSKFHLNILVGGVFVIAACGCAPGRQCFALVACTDPFALTSRHTLLWPLCAHRSRFLCALVCPASVFWVPWPAPGRPQASLFKVLTFSNFNENYFETRKIWMFWRTSILRGFWEGLGKVLGGPNLWFFKIFGNFSKQISKHVLKSSKTASKTDWGSLTPVVSGPGVSLGGRGE